MKLILSTHNKGKLKELKALLHETEVLSLDDFPDITLPEEDGDTFKENALKKARHVFEITNEAVLADDSGLCVDALKGAPGIYSARFAGEKATDKDNNEKLLKELQGTDDRKANFICTLALISKDGEERVFTGKLNGMIAEKLCGASGFGYDPLFVPEGYDKTLAELGGEVKNKISHRANALSKLKKYLTEPEEIPCK
ncbi:MAG: XTP/dITP diphosphatase [Deltaproteobacteria bacterium]|nr:XTP/dITP diphosphatase [Deltaproteobacteria bacterium]